MKLSVALSLTCSLDIFPHSILNKLTPDNFGRLSRELVHLASSSNDRNKLKGAILLVSQYMLIQMYCVVFHYNVHFITTRIK